MDTRPHVWSIPPEPLAVLVLACLAAALAVAWACRRLVRRAAAAACEHERRRIARELHDTLLQSAQALIFELQALAAHPSVDEGLRAALLTAIASAETTLAEGRDRVLALRRTGRAAGDVASMLAAGTRSMPWASELRLRAVVAGPCCGLRPAAQEAAIQIGLEAVHNALRHACAGNVELHLEFGADALRLSVHDDGIGLAAEVLERAVSAGHTGWLGMRERAQAVGARLSWQARPEGGTGVQLSIPAHVAYSVAGGPQGDRGRPEAAQC
jgi:signal transduction histidine kinase